MMWTSFCGDAIAIVSAPGQYLSGIPRFTLALNWAQVLRNLREWYHGEVIIARQSSNDFSKETKEPPRLRQH